MRTETEREYAVASAGLARWCGVALLLFASLGAAADDVSLAMTAVTATREGRETVYMDPGLEQVREALASLKTFDTFRKVKSASVVSALEKEASFPITKEYTLYCTPHSVDESGRILTSIRIEMAPKDKESKPVNVVKLSIRAVPGDPINILGPKVDDANLVVVLAVGKK